MSATTYIEQHWMFGKYTDFHLKKKLLILVQKKKKKTPEGVSFKISVRFLDDNIWLATKNWKDQNQK